jgi:hypothetical protein
MDFRLYKLVGTAQQLSSDDYDRRRAIADFLILLLCEIYKDAASRVFYGEERKDSGAVI